MTSNGQKKKDEMDTEDKEFFFYVFKCVGR